MIILTIVLYSTPNPINCNDIQAFENLLYTICIIGWLITLLGFVTGVYYSTDLQEDEIHVFHSPTVRLKLFLLKKLHKRSRKYIQGNE